MIIGIDPGVTGAIAFIREDGGYHVEDMPVMARGKSSTRKQINPTALYDIIGNNLYLGESRTECYLERVTSMPGQGVASMFSMGDSFGCIRGVLAPFTYPLHVITPQSWKKHYKLGKDKEICRAKAIELFPLAELHRKKDHNRAEALLIAKYGVETGG